MQYILFIIHVCLIIINTVYRLSWKNISMNDVKHRVPCEYLNLRYFCHSSFLIQ